jgi:hypothetical protein
MSTDKILDVAEMEHGPMNEWDEAWYQDDMFVPFQTGEAQDLGLEYDEYGWLDHDYRYDYPGLDDYDDYADMFNGDIDPDDGDDGWYGDYDRDFDSGDEPEEEISVREPKIHLPKGTLIWIDCNSPGSVYIGDKLNYDWHNHNGYAATEVTESWALRALAVGDGDGFGRWNLHICGPLSPEMVAEMDDSRKRWETRDARRWFEQTVSEAQIEYTGHYTHYSSTTKEVEVDGAKVGVEFHAVGHNASHEFSIGLLSDGRIVTRSFGESGEGSEGETLYKENIDILKPGETPSYIGHWIRSSALPHHPEGDGVCRISVDPGMWVPGRNLWGLRYGLPISRKL